jgi:hypothetical protein
VKALVAAAPRVTPGGVVRARGDSYRPWLGGRRLYIKFTVDEDGDLYVLSFCPDGENR